MRVASFYTNLSENLIQILIYGLFFYFTFRSIMEL